MKTALETFETRLQEIRDAGTWREERIITTPQSAHVDTTARKDVLNLCANNYLGLADHPELIAAAKASYDTWGFGLASVRFICGTQQIHKNLERKIASFVGMDDAILYSSCFDANGGLFETLLTAEDAISSIMHPSLTVCAFAGRSATVTATAIWRISEHSWQLQEKKAAGISLLRRMACSLWTAMWQN